MTWYNRKKKNMFTNRSLLYFDIIMHLTWSLADARNANQYFDCYYVLCVLYYNIRNHESDILFVMITFKK